MVGASRLGTIRYMRQKKDITKKENERCKLQLKHRDVFKTISYIYVGNQ